MSNWSTQIEKDLSAFLKDWLRHHGRSQADLGLSLQSNSTRMSSILDSLKEEYCHKGITGVAQCLCEIEASWTGSQSSTTKREEIDDDPFDQLDLILQEMRDNSED